MAFLRGGPAPLALCPLPATCIQDTTCLLLLPNLLLTSMLPNPTLTFIRSLVRQLLQHMRFHLPCLLTTRNSNYSLLQGKYLHSRARLIPLLLKEGGEATRTHLPPVTEVPILVRTLTLATSLRAFRPGRTGRFAQTSPVRVAVFTVTTLTIALSYPRCDRCGSLKPHCADNTPPLTFLLMWPLPSQLCSLILSLNKDSWLPNPLIAIQPHPRPFLVPLTTRSS